jgi:Ca2+/Na+ antiporter
MIEIVLCLLLGICTVILLWVVDEDARHVMYTLYIVIAILAVVISVYVWVKSLSHIIILITVIVAILVIFFVTQLEKSQGVKIFISSISFIPFVVAIVAKRIRQEPDITEDRPQPDRTEDRPQPDRTEDRPQPDRTEDRPQPDRTEDRPQPDRTEDRPPLMRSEGLSTLIDSRSTEARIRELEQLRNRSPDENDELKRLENVFYLQRKSELEQLRNRTPDENDELKRLENLLYLQRKHEFKMRAAKRREEGTIPNCTKPPTHYPCTYEYTVLETPAEYLKMRKDMRKLIKNKNIKTTEPLSEQTGLSAEKMPEAGAGAGAGGYGAAPNSRGDEPQQKQVRFYDTPLMVKKNPDPDSDYDVAPVRLTDEEKEDIRRYARMRAEELAEGFLKTDEDLQRRLAHLIDDSRGGEGYRWGSA